MCMISVASALPQPPAWSEAEGLSAGRLLMLALPSFIED